MKIIAILTDFGNKDNFVGIMKAVMLSINPNLNFIDITNQISPHNIREAAFVLLKSYYFFPKNTIFLVVVDPTVGTERKPIVIRTRNYYFVGPDNGVLYPAASKDKIEEIIWLNRKELFCKNISSTFHGRDVFAPIAAYLTKKILLTKMGKRIKRIKELVFPQVCFSKDTLIGRIIYIDNFGNIVTNIKKNDLFSFIKSNKFIAYLKRRTISNIYSSYGEAPVNIPFFIEDSFGYLEISFKQKRADKYFGVKNNIYKDLSIKIKRNGFRGKRQKR